jgi:peptidoglycan/xylan/chitin deacetylase (PgdA/CDA1 family)
VTRSLLARTVLGAGAIALPALALHAGPDHLSTPHFLRLLDARGIQATFFLLGSQAAQNRGLVKEMAAAGHEIAVHGWTHRPLLLRGPRATCDDLARARDLLAETTGQTPRLFRPPYGAMSTGAYLACRKLALGPVLWTAWGEDWRPRAAAGTVYDTVTRDLHGGATIPLHDSDAASAVGSWQSTLGALPALLDACQRRGLAVGPLRDHQSAPHPDAGKSNVHQQHDVRRRG